MKKRGQGPQGTSKFQHPSTREAPIFNIQRGARSGLDGVSPHRLSLVFFSFLRFFALGVQTTNLQGFMSTNVELIMRAVEVGRGGLKGNAECGMRNKGGIPTSNIEHSIGVGR